MIIFDMDNMLKPNYLSCLKVTLDKTVFISLIFKKGN